MNTTETTKITAARRLIERRRERRALNAEARRLAAEALANRADPLVTDAFFSQVIDASPHEARRIASAVATKLIVRRRTVTIGFSAGRTARLIPHTCIVGAYVTP